MNIKKLVQKSVLAAASVAMIGQAFAGETIDTIKKSGEFVIATRPASFPNAGKPTDEAKYGEYTGYSVEICQYLHNRFDNHFKTNTKIRYLQVDGKSRWLQIDGGNAPLECGSTTWVVERAGKFAKVIIDADSVVPVALTSSTMKTIEDLKGKKIVVVGGTTGEKAIIKLNNEKNYGIEILSVADYPTAMKAVEEGRAEALITDKNLAAGIFAKSGATNSKIIDSIVLVAYEPIAIIMSNRDEEFVSFVKNEVQGLIKSGELWKMHDKWFNQPVPAFNNLNLKVQLTAEQKKSITEQK
ncbi:MULTISPECIES: transporter substrate-binding domain-containing protein [Burkholderia cepacia complex]|uniref:transporter substrate-binding domain-containing protein n=1 Tax=Burkholderia cenocepacia TaxID=95486 RepID=UPI0022389C21|nr:transporter substrate-binding domain-containing protein [Burkholderia cenocepacia]MCW5156396.1 transporter substrate-binding domain-containing protein [Burkholderia cenocepacia]